MKKTKKSTKQDEPEMSVYELSQLMIQGFERFGVRLEKIENYLDDFKAESSENLRLVNEKVSRIAEEQEKISQKLDKVNDKANNTFYLGQEVRSLEARVTKLESK